MKQDQFRNRYIIKLASSVLIVVINVIIQLFLPRALSVEEYGYYTYNLNVFTSVVSIANLSTTNAMISKFSKHNEEIGYVLFYIKFWAFMTIALSIAISILYKTQFFQDTFAGQTFIIVLLGLESVIATSFMSDSIGIFDAMAISRYPAVMQVILKIVICFTILVGYYAGRLSLSFFYISQSVITLTVAIIMLITFFQEQRRIYPKKINKGIKVYAKEYFAFCRPLIIYAFFSQMVVIFTNWALMRWSGAVESAMFGVAWQINTLICFIFSPYAMLSKREFAVIASNTEELKNRFIQALKLIMWITCYFSIFIGFTSEWLLPIIYGDKYSGAGVVTVLIMFYTVYQAWGQIEGAFLIAIERTKLNAGVGIIAQFITIICIFMFQIPNFIWPDSLGSVGIALTYTVSNFLSVGIGIFVCTRVLKVSYRKIECIPFAPILLCSLSSIVLKYAIDKLWAGESIGVLIIKTLISGIIYTGIVGGVIWIHPKFVGMTKESMKALPIVGKIVGRMGRHHK